MVEQNTNITFLDEFWMMILSHRGAANSSELALFNTLIPCDHPRNSQWLDLPQRDHNWFPFVIADCCQVLEKDGGLENQTYA